jgi:hypothetical protein
MAHRPGPWARSPIRAREPPGLRPRPQPPGRGRLRGAKPDWSGSSAAHRGALPVARAPRGFGASPGTRKAVRAVHWRSSPFLVSHPARSVRFEATIRLAPRSGFRDCRRRPPGEPSADNDSAGRRGRDRGHLPARRASRQRRWVGPAALGQPPGPGLACPCPWHAVRDGCPQLPQQPLRAGSSSRFPLIGRARPCRVMSCPVGVIRPKVSRVFTYALKVFWEVRDAGVRGVGGAVGVPHLVRGDYLLTGVRSLPGHLAWDTPLAR